VGASDVVIPDWYQEEIEEGDMILLCSDGFRHIVTKDVMDSYLRNLSTEKEMQEVLETIAEKSMKAGERDNITAILIKVVDDA
jgi:serine/threonine protein phosphatase PrpC